MGQQWGPGQARKFAKEVKLKTKYYTVQEQSEHAATYGPARTYTTHVFTERSGLTGVAMTAGGTSAIQLCRTQGPVYDSPPSGAKNRAKPKNPKPTDPEGKASREFDKRARGLFGRW